MEWGNLPPGALVLVLDHLSDRDRCAASLVCRHWHDAFEDPRLWRHKTFYFEDFVGRKRRARDGARRLEYVGRHGRHLRYLVVRLPVLNDRHTMRIVAKDLVESFERLVEEGADLRQLFAPSLGTHLGIADGNRERLAVALASLLERQHHLEHLNLRDWRGNFRTGIPILRALAPSGEKGNLKRLFLKNFFAPSQSLAASPDFGLAMSSLHGLNQLSLNQHCLQDSTLTTLAANSCGTLERLSVFGGRSESAATATPSAWAALARACPLLRVRVALVGYRDRATVKKILAPAMPLTEFEYHVDAYSVTSLAEFGTGEILAHLRSFARTLESVELRLADQFVISDGHLLDLVTDCEKALNLNLTGSMNSVETAVRLRSLWGSGRLRGLHLDVNFPPIHLPARESREDLQADFGPGPDFFQ